VSKVSGSHVLYRAAVITAAKGGGVSDITVGDVLELLDAELDGFASHVSDRRGVLPDPALRGNPRPGRPGDAAGDTQHRPGAPPKSSSTDIPWNAAPSATCSSSTCASASQR